MIEQMVRKYVNFKMSEEILGHFFILFETFL